jgi:Cd2+/Zn2+-exporting ATPase
VKVGETILVNPGDVIPLDGIITKGSTNINTATIDGESTPIRAIRDQAVLSGCANMLSPIEISVTQNIANSTLTKITNLMKKSLNSKSKAESFMEKFAKFYTPIALVIALLITIIPPLIISYSSIEV